jgi:hypothetical protein
MDNKKAILIGSGVLAFGIVVYIVIRKFSKNKPKPQGLRCPSGYIPANGKCKKTSTTPTDTTNDYGDYTDYSYEYTEYYDEATDSTDDVWQNPGFGTITKKVKTRNGSRLRKEANTNSSIIKTYDSGVTLVVVGESNQSDGVWYKVQESGISPADVKREGWMRYDVVDMI